MLHNMLLGRGVTSPVFSQINNFFFLSFDEMLSSVCYNHRIYTHTLHMSSLFLHTNILSINVTLSLVCYNRRMNSKLYIRVIWPGGIGHWCGQAACVIKMACACSLLPGGGRSCLRRVR